MIDDIVKSIKANLYDRVASPLFGGFFISWCVWNYKTILTLLSSLEVSEKVLFIEGTIYPTVQNFILQGFFYPLLTAVIFLLLYPFPAKWVYKYWHTKQKELKEIKQQIEDDTPLTIKESRELRRQLHTLQSELDSELGRKDTEIERLKTFITNLENKSSSRALPTRKIKKKKSPQAAELDKNQLKIIQLIAVTGGVIEERTIFSKIGMDKVKTSYFLDDLQSKDYIARTDDKISLVPLVQLKVRGKKLAIDMGMVK